MKTEASRNNPEGRVLVLGLGVSGRFACELLLRQGAEVVGADMNPRGKFGDALDRLESLGCKFQLGSHKHGDFLGVDRIIVSPGVPLDLEPLREAAGAGIEITGELDWAWRQVDAPVVAITGTNGKTTTTTLVGEMFRAAGKKVFVGGNIGDPLSMHLLNGDRDDLLVLEVSSFQLDAAEHFRPDAAALLNVTEDHLDRYESFRAYADSKLSLFARQRAGDVAVLNADDPLCREGAATLPVRPLLFSGRGAAGADAVVRDGKLHAKMPGREPFVFELSRSPLKGAHNAENILAAVLVAGSMGVSGEAMRDALERFHGLPHRVEWVGRWNGIDFYDDSKGTNVGAVVKALEGFDRPVWLFLGGRDKQGSYEPLVDPIRKGCKGVYAFGEAAPRIVAGLAGRAPVLAFPDLEAAFEDAAAKAAPGDVMLLSPACSSFDQYTSYAKRGDHFKRLVAALTERRADGAPVTQAQGMG